ncbi:MAG: NADH-quinone oxidoreductase subunit NuoG [Deltaproteobacteria bacterium]|nr:MAG: NADH-quinone oxidoreductase subunit NuoG [Deltaproteobacteria bacterium]
MPKIIIDNHEIEVPEGTKVIEAAEQLGIMIPRFCYHPALGSVGACRVCAVKFLEGPFKGVQMSCMIDVKDGMIVSTTDEEAVEFRQYVIEWLMLNHPHDCPVCDEGGHCLLQDMTISGGHGMRRYLGLKRTYRDQYLGPLVQHEMNRCIHCYRCSRFYQEFAGYFDLGVMQSANRTYFGRFKDGILESPFTGNLSDICPTGVYTDRPSRFFGRRWDYQRSPSLCINCSLGCHTTASARYREVVRQEARYSEAVNGYFICDRGRHGFHYARNETRPRRALIEGREVSTEEAIRAAREKLAELVKSAGPDSIACLGSGRSGLETQAMLKQLCQEKGWQGPSYFMDKSLAGKVKTAVSRLDPELAVSLHQLEGSDAIIVVGADPINEAPMLALAMRQAQRHGGKIAVVDPRPIFLPFDFTHLPVRPDEINLYLSALIKGAVDPQLIAEAGKGAAEFYQVSPSLEIVADSLQEKASILAQELRAGQKVVIVCGTQIVRETTPALAADHAQLLRAAKKQVGLFYLLPQANSFGASLLTGDEVSFSEILEGIEDGRVKSLILAENDPFYNFHDRQRLDLAIEKLDLLVVLDYFESAAVKKAQVFLPTSTLYEGGGIFINQEGRLQAAPKAYLGGISIAQIGGGNHPPRVYGRDIPGGEVRAAHQFLTQISNGDQIEDDDHTQRSLLRWIADNITPLPEIPPFDELAENGMRISSSDNTPPYFAVKWQEEKDKGNGLEDSLEIILTDWTFGTEELSSFSPPLRKLERSPCASMHTKDAARLGLDHGDKVKIKLDEGDVEVDVCAEENMASGAIVLPRHRLLEWQKIKSFPKFVSYEDVKKVST